jgi:hypothetical protein
VEGFVNVFTFVGNIVIYLSLTAIICIIIVLIAKQKRELKTNKSAYDTIYQELVNMNASDGFFMQDYIEKRLEEIFLNNYTLIRELISYLNIIGLLGTFLGMVVVLPELANLESMSSTVTRGMATALISSIIGLLSGITLSAIYGIAMRGYYKIIEQKKNEIAFKVLKNKGSFGGELNVLNDIIQHQLIPIVKQMDKATSENTLVMDDMKKWAEKQIEHNMQLIKEYSEQSRVTIDHMVSVLKEENKNISDIKKEWGSTVKILSDTSRNVKSVSKIITNFEPLYQRLIDQIDNFSAEFTELFVNLKEIINQTSQPNKIMSNLYDIINSNMHSNEVLREILVGFKNSNEEQLSTIVEAIENNTDLKDYLESLKVELINDQNYMATEIKELNNTVVLEIAQAIMAFNSLSLEMVDSIKNSQLSHSDRLISNLNEMIANHKSQQIEKTLSGIARPLDTLISNTNNTKQSIEKLYRNLAKVLDEVLEGDIS